jgi:hypothetical protein
MDNQIGDTVRFLDGNRLGRGVLEKVDVDDKGKVEKYWVRCGGDLLPANEIFDKGFDARAARFR